MALPPDARPAAVGTAPVPVRRACSVCVLPRRPALPQARQDGPEKSWRCRLFLTATPGSRFSAVPASGFCGLCAFMPVRQARNKAACAPDLPPGRTGPAHGQSGFCCQKAPAVFRQGPFPSRFQRAAPPAAAPASRLHVVHRTAEAIPAKGGTFPGRDGPSSSRQTGVSATACGI